MNWVSDKALGLTSCFIYIVLFAKNHYVYKKSPTQFLIIFFVTPFQHLSQQETEALGVLVFLRDWKRWMVKRTDKPKNVMLLTSFFFLKKTHTLEKISNSHMPDGSSQSAINPILFTWIHLNNICLKWRVKLNPPLHYWEECCSHFDFSAEFRVTLCTAAYRVVLFYNFKKAVFYSVVSNRESIENDDQILSCDTGY